MDEIYIREKIWLLTEHAENIHKGGFTNDNDLIDIGFELDFFSDLLEEKYDKKAYNLWNGNVEKKKETKGN